MTSQILRLNRGNGEIKSDNLFCVFFPFPLRKSDAREKGVIGSEGQEKVRKGERESVCKYQTEQIEALTLTVYL